MRDIVIIVLLIAVMTLVLKTIVLNKKVKHLETIKELEVITSRQVISSLVERIIDAYQLIEEEKEDMLDYQQAYERCHKEFSKLYRYKQTVIIREQEQEKRYQDLFNMYQNMCGNMYDLIREGKIIKEISKDSIQTYDIEQMTKGEVIELFGDAR